MSVDEFLFDGGSPRIAVGPRRLASQVERYAVITPIDQIVGREDRIVPSAPAVHTVCGGVDVVASCLVGVEYLGVGMESREDGVLGRFGHTLRAAPAVEQLPQLGCRDGHDGAVARMEIHAYLVVDGAERTQVVALGELVAAAHIYVVHEYVAVLADEFECTGTLDGICRLLLVVGLLLPFAGCE